MNNTTNRPAAPAPFDTPPVKTAVAVVDFDCFHISVFLFVGTDSAAIQRRFLALLKRRGAPLSITKQRRIFADVESVARDVFASDSTITAVCIWPKLDKQTPFIWLSRYDHGDLVHEITHAVASIIDNRNLEGPGNSEVRAYLTEHLVRKFTKYVTPKAK